MVEILRVIFLIAAGVALYRLVRAAWIGADPRMRLIVGVGFLVRALASQVLFWISFLSLPVAPALQSGGGLWFFADDATSYTSSAASLTAAGLDDIVSASPMAPSVTYLQALALFSLLFGHVVAVSLLLNLFCYAAACAIIVRWSAMNPGSRIPAIIALAAISFSPAGILWSMQPLKDTFFQFLIVAFFGGCVLWQRAWHGERASGRVVWAGAGLLTAHFLLSGVRWYIGLTLFVAAAMFLAGVVLTQHGRRWPGSIAAILLLLVMSRAYLYAAGPYLPPQLLNAFRFKSSSAPVTRELVTTADRVRHGYEITGGNTSIKPGRAVTRRRQKVTPSSAAGRTTSPPAPVEVGRVEKLVAGTMAATVPRGIANRLGLVEIGESQAGLSWFADLDTLFSDMILLATLVVTMVAFRRRTARSPLFWLVLLATLVNAGALFYAITNFGTLFRLRLMILTSLALIPLALYSSAVAGTKTEGSVLVKDEGDGQPAAVAP